MTDQSGKRLYDNPLFPDQKPVWVTIYPDEAGRYPILGAVSKDAVLNLIQEIGQLRQKRVKW